MFVKFTGLFPCPAALLTPVCSAYLLSILLATAPANAQQPLEPIPAKPEHSAYQQDRKGTIVRSSDGLCWRTGYWTKEDAVAGCDGPLAPPIGRLSAPPLTSEPAPAVTMQSEPPPIPTRPTAACDFSVTLGGDQSFAFNSAVLSNEARQQLQQEVVARLEQCAGAPTIRITGHTDRLGSAQYNRQLSLRRAQAVATYLLRQGIRINAETVGAGAAQASTQCDERQNRQALLACLAPDRRVTLEVRGEVRGTRN